MFVKRRGMNLFKKVLIPVNEGMDVSVAIKKALELKDHDTPLCIHFLICNYRNTLYKYFSYFKSGKFEKIDDHTKSFPEHFYYIKKEIYRQSDNCSIVIDILNRKNISRGVINYIKEHEIDLLLFCKKRLRDPAIFLKRMDFNKIAGQSSCATLSVTPGSLNHSVKSIILPVGSFLPERKIEIAVAFAQKYNALIHLVTLLDDADSSHSKKKVDIFYKTYKILKDCGYPPQYKILPKYESHEILLRYAEQVNADLILLNPQENSIIPRINDNSVVDFISPLSHLLVLMTKPNMVV